MELEDIMKKHIEIFEKDLGAELARDFVSKFYKELNCSNSNFTNEKILREGANIFSHLSERIYGPIMCSFVDWILKGYDKTEKNGKILFLARDAIPLFKIAETLMEKKKYENIGSCNLGLVYLTRKLAGEADEIAQFEAKNINGTMLRYLAQAGLNENSLLVDMGAYGSLYNKGNGLFWDKNNNPSLVFFYSKNPKVMGFLNAACGDYSGKMSQKQKDIGNIIMDSMECINPQKHWTPGEFIEKGGMTLPLLEEINDSFIQHWHSASIEGYVKAATNYALGNETNVNEELANLQFLSDKAKEGKWTGVLPHITPEWSLKQAFLDNTPEYAQKTGKEGWRLGVAPPLGSKEFHFFLNPGGSNNEV